MERSNDTHLSRDISHHCHACSKYAGFSLAGILSFPATIIVDYYLDHVDSVKAPFRTVELPPGARRARAMGARGSQPVVPGGAPSASPSKDVTETELGYHVPIWVQSLLLLFPIFMALAGDRGALVPSA